MLGLLDHAGTNESERDLELGELDNCGRGESEKLGRGKAFICIKLLTVL